MKFHFLFLLFFFLLNCKNSREKDTYEIYNTVLKEKISTYGIMATYLPHDRYYSDGELENIATKISDSLIKAETLNYFLDENLTILDTLNPSDEFYSDLDLVITFKPKYSKNKIDFSKIENLKIGKRLEKELAIDENQKNPVYLGSYDLSEPVYISENKAVIRYQLHCGSKCGLGILIYLEKENNQWKITKEQEIWIS